jgi:hypothetical protein
MILALLLATGCILHNACQRLCNDMRNYAKDECGLEWSKEQLQECYKEQRRGNLPENLTVGDCRDAAPFDEDEWTCEDFEDYFDEPAEAADSAQ